MLQAAKRVAKNFLYGGRINRLLRSPSVDRPVEATIDAAVEYVMSRRVPKGAGFCFTSRHSQRDAYSTSYAVSLLGLVGRLDLLARNEQEDILAYFDSLQCADGLYRDPLLISPQAETGQGWGWMHLVPHTLIALDYLGGRPRLPLSYALEPFKDRDPADWYRQLAAIDRLTSSNHFMNRVTALQYSRGEKSSSDLEPVIASLLDAANTLIDEYLHEANGASAHDRSEAVKTIYHLVPNIVFDRRMNPARAEAIIDLAGATQLPTGGFGVSVLSDACEDMDSIYLIATASRERADVAQVLEKGRRHLAMTQNDDGGFVFRRFTAFSYGGCEALTSADNESNMFATWFRLLAYALVDQANGPSYRWHFARVPGYQFWPESAVTG